MTSRTTPVGIVVMALAGFIAVGCSAPTNAVFQALLDPAGTVVSTPEAEPAASAAATGETSTWWQHPQGYEMVLPAGWSGVAVDLSDTDDLVEAVDLANPGLGDRIDAVIGGTEVRVSAIAARGEVEGEVPPVLLVLTEPRAGRKKHVVKSDVYDRISTLDGLDGGLAPHDVRLPAAEGVRYDYTITDADLGEIRVQSWLFFYGPSVYLVSFLVSADLANDAAVDFDEIQNSLRFGV